MQRDRLGSRLGFILLSAGCAIGIGNVWKFPYITGQNGGGIFVLIYLFCLALIGIPVMTIEFSLGRASQQSPAKLYNKLEKKGSKWHLHGYASMIGNYVFMMFYTVVAGWMIQYFVLSVKGEFSSLSVTGITERFAQMTNEPLTMLAYTAFVVIIGFVVCGAGLQGGLERVTKYMMLALLGIMVVFAINSCTLDGASKGLEFYLKPNVEAVKEIGIGNVIVAALNQSFFTLSLGMGSMAIFGSYLNKDRSLMGESINVAVLDTFVAIVSGLIIFPACFAYGVEPDSGPNLIFITLPNIFNNMPAGRLWGSFFFIFMSFAALSTVFTVFESIIACSMDVFGWARKKACAINCVIVLALSTLTVLGFNVLSFIKPFGEGTTIMDLSDFLISNLLLPLGSLCYVVFATSKRGWGWKKFLKEANSGKGLKVRNGMRIYVSYILPVIMFALFVVGIYNFFK